MRWISILFTLLFTTSWAETLRGCGTSQIYGRRQTYPHSLQLYKVTMTQQEYWKGEACVSNVTYFCRRVKTTSWFIKKTFSTVIIFITIFIDILLLGCLLFFWFKLLFKLLFVPYFKFSCFPSPATLNNCETQITQTAARKLLAWNKILARCKVRGSGVSR